MKLKNKYSGFTLLELLVVISIIGILVAVGSVSYGSINRRSRDAKRISDLEQVRNALELYKSDQSSNTYPNGPYSSLGSTLGGSAGYISSLPLDPKPGQTYLYTPAGAPLTTYCMCADLEGSSSPGMAGCAPGGTYDYCVKQP